MLSQGKRGTYPPPPRDCTLDEHRINATGFYREGAISRMKAKPGDLSAAHSETYLEGDQERAMKLFYAILITAFIFSQNIYAQDTSAANAAEHDNESTLSAAQQKRNEIIVVAERLQTPYKEIGSSVTAFNSTEIENAQKSNMADLLRQVPGVTVARTGIPGGTTSVFIRGAESDHTLVLLDGIELNDPSNPVRSFDFGQFEMTNIEQVEVLRGSQSTLYGSDAIGGVINLRTKKGSGKPKFFVSSEMGSFETFREEAGVSGGTELVNYSFGISHTYSDGFTSASHNLGNREKDDYQNMAVSTRIGITPAENFELSTIIRYEDSEIEIDDADPTDDPNNISYIEKLFLREQAEWMVIDDFYEQIFGFSISEYNRNTNDNPDDIDPYFTRSYADGKWYQFDYQHNLYFPEFNICNIGIENILSCGIEFEKERAETSYKSSSMWGLYESYAPERTANTWSFFIQDKLSFSKMFYTTFGARWDQHSLFGTNATARVVPTIWIEQTGTKLKSSWSTGFKAPTIAELYGSGGNPDLDPEESESWEIGFEQYLFTDRILCGMTYFQNDYDDLITSVLVDPMFFIFGNRNVEQAESNGLEMFCNVYPTENLSLGVNYTYLQTKHLSDTDSLDDRTVFLRRPKNSVSITANYSFCNKRGNIYTELLYVGGREDKNFNVWPVERTRLEGYTLINMAAKFAVTDNIEIFGRMHNILDDSYEEVFNYDTQRFSLFGGVKLKI